MSGHSKWSTIKRKKALVDAKRGNSFTKIIREIISAARQGGGDPSGNPRLRTAVDKAKEVNMPNDNINRAIARGTGEIEGVTYEEDTYEAYAPGGVGVIIEVMTDNKNRTMPELRNVLEKKGGSMAAKGAVSYNFKKKGLIIFTPGADEAKIMDTAIEAGAEDIATQEDGSIEVTAAASDFQTVREALVKAGLNPASAEVTMISGLYVDITGEAATKFEELIATLEENDDVQNVYHNATIGS